MPPAAEQSALDGFIARLSQLTAVTVATMVSSVDGRATIDGRVGALTGEPDQRVLLAVREHAAAIVIGAGTQRGEGYDGLLNDAAQSRRRSRGLPAEPELVVVRRDGPTPVALWQELRERHPDGLIASEGGPTLLGAELAENLIDQLILCVSPQLVGRNGERRIVEHEQPIDRPLDLLDCAHADGFTFLRYQVTR